MNINAIDPLYALADLAADAGGHPFGDLYNEEPGRDWGPDPDPSPYIDRDPEAAYEPVLRARSFSAATLEGKPIPEREWHVPDLIPAGTVTLFSGDGGTGKSLVSLQLAAATAIGADWIGMKPRKGGVLYISAEDDAAELHRRVAEIARGQGRRLSELRRLTLASLADEDALLAHTGPSGGLVPSRLYHELDARMGDEKPALLVLDTLADLFPGNENDRAQARQFIGLLRRLAIRHGAAVVLLSHPSLSGLGSGSGSSGSTGWNNSVRSRLYLERIVSEGFEANPDARRLVTKKANYGRTGGEIGLTWREGVFVANAPTSGLDRMAASSRAQRVFLKLLREWTEEGRYVTAANSSANAPKCFADDPRSEGVSKAMLKAAMNELFSAKRIAVEEYGPPSKRRTRLAEVQK
jgi:RecA-family ATPase